MSDELTICDMAWGGCGWAGFADAVRLSPESILMLVELALAGHPTWVRPSPRCPTCGSMLSPADSIEDQAKGIGQHLSREMGRPVRAFCDYERRTVAADCAVDDGKRARYMVAEEVLRRDQRWAVKWLAAQLGSHIAGRD